MDADEKPKDKMKRRVMYSYVVKRMQRWRILTRTRTFLRSEPIAVQNNRGMISSREVKSEMRKRQGQSSIEHDNFLCKSA